jgi:hypothetical protein
MSVTFSGGSGYSRTGNLIGTGAHTVAAYVKITTDRNNYQSFVGADDFGGNFSFVGAGSDGTTYIPDSTGGVALNTGVSMTTGTWYYVAVTRSSGGTGHAYIAALGGGSLADTSGSRAAATGVTNSYIGTDGYGSYLEGEMAYVRIWAAELSSSELESERTSTTAVRTSNLTASYDFATASTTDNSGNGNTLTAIATPGSGTSPSISSSTVPLHVLQPGVPYTPNFKGWL